MVSNSKDTCLEVVELDVLGRFSLTFIVIVLEADKNNLSDTIKVILKTPNLSA